MRGYNDPMRVNNIEKRVSLRGLKFPSTKLTKDSYIYRHRADVFDMLLEEYQQELMEHLNQDWLCAGAMFMKWPSDREEDCVGCCTFCKNRGDEECEMAFKCHDFNPLLEMDNCLQWITRGEALSIMFGKLKRTDIDNRRRSERRQLFKHYHQDREEHW